MRSDNIALSVRELGKTYRLFAHPADRVKQLLSFGLRQYHRPFCALQSVSFDVRRGETLGIIGRNGAGKSTLLQLVCGILRPTTGRVVAKGRISALLELGAGFNPAFTGRENVYFQGALLGFKHRQMQARFDEIAEFAEIGDFIDQPVRTYSTGMFVRLAMAVSIHCDPDILVVDEALSVGDLAFQKKCFQKTHAIKQAGGSILLVTHSLEQVAHQCDRALLLDKGKLIIDADVHTTLRCYQQRLNESPNAETSRTSRPAQPGCAVDNLSQRRFYNPGETRWGDGKAAICDAAIVQNEVEEPESYRPLIRTEIRFWCEFRYGIDDVVFGIAIKTRDGMIHFGSNSKNLLGEDRPKRFSPGDKICVRFAFTPEFGPAEYLVSLGIASESGAELIPHDRRYDVLIFDLRAKPKASETSGSETACWIEKL